MRRYTILWLKFKLTTTKIKTKAQKREEYKSKLGNIIEKTPNNIPHLSFFSSIH